MERVKLKIKRQDGPHAASYWQSFEIPWQPHMNVISALMEIQKRPVTAGGERITPVRLIEIHTADGDLELLYRFFAEWEMWTAEVLESHVSYPMLALFRSQHLGQSWVTALGVVTDAATLTCAAIEGADNREPYFMYRRGRRAVADISDRLHLRPREGQVSWLNRDNFEVAWNGIVELDLPLRDKEDAWRRLQDLRKPYGAQLQELIDFLLAPHGFWGHSAEEHVTEDVAQAIAAARRRARRGQS